MKNLRWEWRRDGTYVTRLSKPRTSKSHMEKIGQKKITRRFRRQMIAKYPGMVQK